MKKWLATLLGLTVSIVVVAVLLSKSDLQATKEILADTGISRVFLLVGIYLTTFPLRGLRWKTMLPEQTLTVSQCLNAVIVGYAGNNVLPARGGEFLRMEYAYRSQPSMGRVAALTSIALERVLDGLTLLAVLLISLTFANFSAETPPWLNKLLLMVACFFGVAILGAIVLKFLGAGIIAKLQSFEHKGVQKLAEVIQKFQVAVQFLGPNKPTFMVVCLGILIWLIEGLMFVVAANTLGVQNSAFAAGYVALGIVNFGLLVPSSPGYIGVFQGMTILAMSIFGIENDRSLATGLLVHVCQYVPVTLWGLIIFWRNSARVHAKHATKSDEQST